MRKRPERWQDLLKLDHRWPKKGDRLLRPTDDWDRGVDFSSDPISKHAHQWHGYMSAGAGLIALCTQGGFEQERHFVIYPILFNYRHGLELAMKWIILYYSGQGIQGMARTHNLWTLWSQCRTIIDQYGDDDKEATDAVEQIIKEFHDLDQKGITFRYGWDNDGQTIKLPGSTIDLENIRDVMDGVAGYFTGLDGWLDSAQSAGP